MGKAFHTAHRWQVEWQDDTDVLTLGHGVQVKIGTRVRPPATSDRHNVEGTSHDGR